MYRNAIGKVQREKVLYFAFLSFCIAYKALHGQVVSHVISLLSTPVYVRFYNLVSNDHNWRRLYLIG